MKNNIQMVVDLGTLETKNSYKRFHFKPKFCRKIIKAAIISNDYFDIQHSPNVELGLWINNKSVHIGKIPTYVGEQPDNVVNKKFIELNREIDSTQEISGFVKATQSLNNANVQLLLILEK